jgi:uncharacterized protein YjbI with pentapeptide repeats
MLCSSAISLVSRSAATVPIPYLRAGLGTALLLVVLIPGGAALAAPRAGLDCPETRAQLAGQDLTKLDKLPDLQCADLHGATLDGLDLVQVDLSGADARDASFRDARLIQADLTGADLRGAHFEHADLGQADLVRADARGAFFGDAGLDQADLNDADLRDADFVSASLIQTDLNDADLRGAKTYWANSVQADVSGARVDLTDPRNVQLSMLAVLAALILLVRSVVTVARGRGTGYGLRKGTTRVVLFLVAGLFFWQVIGMLFPLLLVVVLYPALLAAALLFLSGLVHGYVPKRS